MSKTTSFSPKNFLVLLIAVTMWGSTFPAIKIALGEIEPITLGLFRAIFGLIPIGLFTIWIRGWERIVAPFKDDFPLILGIALTQFFLPLVSQNVGMTLMDPETAASMSSLLQATAPIFTIFLSVIFLEEYIGVKKSLGTATALTGTLMLVTRGGVVLHGVTLVGNLMLLGSAVFYAISGLLVKKALDDYGPLSILSLALFFSVLFFIPTTYILEDTAHIFMISSNSWLLAIYLGLFANGIVLILWYYVLRSKELSKQILFIYLIPFFGIIFSYLFADEAITIQTFIFGAVILIGITIAQYEKEKNRS